MTLPSFPYKGDQIPNSPFNSAPVPATFDRLFGSLVANDQLDPNPSEQGGANWVRPSDWLEMPQIYPTEQKFVGLFAIYNVPINPVALHFEGDYSVDWGDGSTEDVSSGFSQHVYQWADVPSSTTTTKGYRQVLVTVTPQSGSDLTYMDLTARHDYVNSSYENSSPWLDLAISMPQANTGQSLYFSDYPNYLVDTQRVNIVHAGDMDDFYDLFYGLFSLGSVTIQNSPNAEDFGYLFDYCYNLTSVELMDTSTVQYCYDMFYSCHRLQNAPMFDTSSVTDMGYMFQDCYSLTNVPLYDTTSVQDIHNMFDYCYALKTVPLLDTSNLAYLGEMFYYCYSLVKVPELDLSSTTNTGAMFNNCSNLQIAALQGTATYIDYSNCLLSRESIIDIFNGLAAASEDIDLYNNYGANELNLEDIEIATDKGWTVNF